MNCLTLKLGLQKLVFHHLLSEEIRQLCVPRNHEVDINLFVFLIQCWAQKLAPVIEIESGKVSGIIEQSFSGQEYSSYLGIPFAEPPTGNLRFKVNHRQSVHYLFYQRGETIKI